MLPIVFINLQQFRGTHALANLWILLCAHVWANLFKGCVFFFLVDKGCDADLIEAIEFGGKQINSKKAKLSNYIWLRREFDVSDNWLLMVFLLVRKSSCAS